MSDGSSKWQAYLPFDGQSWRGYTRRRFGKTIKVLIYKPLCGKVQYTFKMQQLQVHPTQWA